MGDFHSRQSNILTLYVCFYFTVSWNDATQHYNVKSITLLLWKTIYVSEQNSVIHMGTFSFFARKHDLIFVLLHHELQSKLFKRVYCSSPSAPVDVTNTQWGVRCSRLGKKKGRTFFLDYLQLLSGFRLWVFKLFIMRMRWTECAALELRLVGKKNQYRTILSGEKHEHLWLVWMMWSLYISSV